MRQIIFIAIFFLLAPCTFAQNKGDIQELEVKSIDFNLRIDPESPHIGTFSANTSDLIELTLLEPRAIPFSDSGNAAEINCVYDNLTTPVTYGESVQCNRLEWEVTFDNVEGHDVSVSEQKNLYSESGWWVLFEWAVIPRIQEDLKINICTYSSDNISEKVCKKLPGESQAPLLFIWGKPTIEFESPGRKFRIFTDSSGSELINQRTQQRLSKQYGYLSGLFSTIEFKDIPDAVIDIAWAGIDENLKTIGGAAGESAYISNYAITDNNFELSQERLFWVSGHETFHMISSYSYPLWISESLAHYYGYKSFAQHSPALLNPIQEWEKQKNSNPYGKTGLYEAHANVLKGEGNYYGLFYSKGAAFWHDLDTHLEKKDNTLDHYLSLLSSSQQENGELSKEFITAMIDIIGKQDFTHLEAKYLQ